MSDNGKKEGIELILDLAEGLRVRLAAAHAEHTTPPTTAADSRLADGIGYWEQIAKGIVTEATRLKVTAEYQPLRTVYATIDRVTALLALPGDTPGSEICKAVETAIRRLQELEKRVADFSEASTATMRPFDPTVGGGAAPDLVRAAPSVRPTVSREQLKQAFGDEEPRPSYVLERMEALILGSWLGDAVKNLERCAEYMAANESRMSEDVFDELRRTAGKLQNWADEIIRGNMFPRPV